MTRIVLASASPRRKALLAAMGLTFDVVSSDAAETLDGEPATIVVTNARVKRDDVAARLATSGSAPRVSSALVIAADTLVFLDDHVLGKPADATEARAMLMRLSGRTHQVLTGLALIDTASGKTAEGSESTDVTFRELSSMEIDRFIQAVAPMDRAGAYTVDGPGSLLVRGYEGCYQNVLGLPIVKLDLLLRQVGYNLFDLMNGPRSVFL